MRSFDKIDVIFATGSPRRKYLANKLKCVCEPVDGSFGRRFIVNPIFEAVGAAETILCDAAKTAAENARRKSAAAYVRFGSRPILAFDTVVGKDSLVFGKPTDRTDAVRMFKELCGYTHEVVTAVVLRCGENLIEKIEKTYVTFDAFDAQLVYNYVDSGKPYDKAGGYNIDDAELMPLIKRVDGDYDNVVGLPVALTEKLIEENLNYGEDGYSA